MCCYTHPVVRVVSSEQAVVLGWVGGGILNPVGCLCVWLLATFLAVLVYSLYYFFVLYKRYMLIPEPFYHLGLWTLIHISGTQGPRIQQCVARTRVMDYLLRTYPHVHE